MEFKKVKLSDLGEVVTGKTPPTKNEEYYGNKFPFITPTDINGSARYIETERYLSEEGYKYQKNALLPSGSTCFVCIGATIGKICMTKNPSFTNQQINSIKPDTENYDPKFIYYLLSTKGKGLKQIAGGAATPIVNKSSFSDFEVKVPDLTSQKEIASILSAFDDLIENNTRRIEILEEMARRIYREWFVHFRYPGHEDDELVDSGTELGKIPEGWEVKKLEDFGEIVLGKTPSTKDSANYGDYMPFIKTPDMHDQYFIHETENVLSKKGVETQKKKTLPADSICVSCIGTAGVVAITSVPSQTNQQINSIVPKDKALREYLYFTTKALKPLMEKIGSTGATMTNVSKTKFKGLPALSAPEDVINKFHAKVGPLFDQISTLQKQNDRLKETRDLLLPKLISGKIDVEELNIN